MVVQEEDDAPIEAPLSKQTKKFIVVKNHVRELLLDNEKQNLSTSDSVATDKSHTAKKKALKRKKVLKTESSSDSGSPNISESDLEELRTVYTRCKAVLQKIELKYGHLLDLEHSESLESSQNKTSEESSCDYCTCSQKKKIVFDENGEQIEKDCHVESHICVKRVKRSHSDLQPKKPSVQVDYDNINLPNDLQELENILKDGNISKSYRRMVIDKIYLIKQESMSVMRYEKEDIIKKLKENPDNVLDFKGTNLSSLHGYPTKPVTTTDKK